MKLIVKVGFTAIATIAVWAALAARSDAMPMFSRRYHMACNTCHDAPAYPRLNEVGYMFRRAGFRMPEQIGEVDDGDFDLAHYFSARTQTRYSLTRTGDGTSGSFEMREVTAFPLTGAFDRRWASLTKLMLDASGRPTVNNAYVRGVWGNADRWFEARAGIGHPIEGYGASDRPLGASRPMFETATSFDTQDTQVRVWGPDRVGAEIGVQWQRTSVSASVLERLNPTGTGTAGMAKDLVVFANQMIGEHGAVSAYWMRGSVDLPVDVDGFAAETDRMTWRNTYHRGAIFGTAGNGRVLALAGLGAGIDRRSPVAGGGRFTSGGGFLEFDVAIAPSISSFARADYFDPSWRRRDVQRVGGTIGALYTSEWIKFVSELAVERGDTSLRLHATVAF